MNLQTSQAYAIPGLPKREDLPEIILESVIEATGVTLEEMKGNRKNYRIVAARRKFWYLLNYYKVLRRSNGTLTLSEAGGMLNRNHATVLHSINMQRQLNSVYPQECENLMEIKKLVNEKMQRL